MDGRNCIHSVRMTHGDETDEGSALISAVDIIFLPTQVSEIESRRLLGSINLHYSWHGVFCNSVIRRPTPLAKSETPTQHGSRAGPNELQ